MPSHGIYTGRSVDRGHHQSSPAHPFDPRTTPIYAGQPSNSTSRYQQAVPYSGQSLHQAAMWTPEIGPGVYPSNSMMGHANPNSRDAAAYGRQDYHSSHHSMPPRSATPGPSSATNYRNLVLHEQEGHSDEGSSKARYECEYCGKGFLRPSALRVRESLNNNDSSIIKLAVLLITIDPYYLAHRRQRCVMSIDSDSMPFCLLTCPLDFVCPEQGCGRRFGVRSNMLRHVRLVHQNINDEQDGRETRDWDDM